MLNLRSASLQRDANTTDRAMAAEEVMTGIGTGAIAAREAPGVMITGN
jgi:hypothetical protein